MSQLKPVYIRRPNRISSLWTICSDWTNLNSEGSNQRGTELNKVILFILFNVENILNLKTQNVKTVSFDDFNLGGNVKIGLVETFKRVSKYLKSFQFPMKTLSCHSILVRQNWAHLDVTYMKLLPKYHVSSSLSSLTSLILIRMKETVREEDRMSEKFNLI